MAAMLCKLGFSEAIVRSKMAAGTSTFVLAYAIHKLFAPARISITLVSVPLIVRYFRKTGLFKSRTPSPWRPLFAKPHTSRLLIETPVCSLNRLPSTRKKKLLSAVVVNSGEVVLFWNVKLRRCEMKASEVCVCLKSRLKICAFQKPDTKVGKRSIYLQSEASSGIRDRSSGRFASECCESFPVE